MPGRATTEALLGQVGAIISKQRDALTLSDLGVRNEFQLPMSDAVVVMQTLLQCRSPRCMLRCIGSTISTITI